MHPILFYVGDFPVHTYGAMGALGFLVVALMALVRARALGVKPERTADLILVTGALSLIGSRAIYLLQNPEHIDGWTSLLDLRSGGLVFYGALLTGLGVGSVMMRLFRMPYFAMWDVFATAFPLAHAIARLGCFGAGCCYGAPTDLPWGITFTSSASPAPTGVPLHPTQLYEAGWLLLVGIAVNLFYRRKRFHGQVMLLYLLLYAVGRSVIEAFRGDAERGWFLPELLGELFTWSQGISAVVALLALAIFFAGARRSAASRAPP